MDWHTWNLGIATLHAGAVIASAVIVLFLLELFDGHHGVRLLKGILALSLTIGAAVYAVALFDSSALTPLLVRLSWLYCVRNGCCRAGNKVSGLSREAQRRVKAFGPSRVLRMASLIHIGHSERNSVGGSLCIGTYKVGTNGAECGAHYMGDTATYLIRRTCMVAGGVPTSPVT